MKNTVKRLLSFAVAVLMVLSVSGSVFALEHNGQANTGALESKTAVSYDLSGIRNGKTFDISDENVEEEIAADQIVPIMVKLSDAPAMEVYSKFKAAANYAESLRVKQDAAVKSIRKALNADVDVIYNYTLLFNGFAFNGEYRLVEEINKMDGMSAFVAPEWDNPEIQLFSSGDMIGAIDAWDLDYTGEGRAIAIVDTGMKVDHEAFSTDPDNPRFTQSDIAALIASGDLQGSNMNVSNVYYSAKIPFRWNYVKNNYNVDHAAVGSDHGTHVAGIAAGNGGQIVGVAKDAQLFAMNVFNDGGGAGWVAILAALEDCVVIGVDSANMSLGSPCGFTHYYDPSYAQVFENLVNAGVNLAVSAGNEYSTALRNKWAPSGIGYALVQNPDYGVTGSPSTWAQSLGVASVDNVKNQLNYIQNVADEQMYSYTENSDNVAKLIPTFGGQTVDFVAVPGFGTEEDFAQVNVEGKFAVVSRGSINFVDKGKNAQAAGAVGCIVYNNTDGSINMVSDPDITIPFIFVLKDSGDAMAQQGEGQLYIATEPAVMDAPGGGQPSDFSSWGTTSDLFMKPEIAAPGGNIFSSTDPSISNTLYDTWSGTSMAAPHVAGGMAIVSAYVDDVFPELTTGEKQVMVDTILMSTADPVVDEGGDLASPRKQGAGLMDLASAVKATSYITVENNVRPKLELGDDPERTGVYELVFTVHNFGEEDLTYTVDPHVLIDDLTAIDVDPEGNYVIAYTQTSWDVSDYCEFDGPETITVPAGGSTEVAITLTLTSDITEYLEEYYVTGAYIEGFVELYGEGGMTGDVNGDGVVDTADALAVMRYAMGIGELEEPSFADVNGDGNIDMADALLILRYASGVSTDFVLGDFAEGVDLNVPFLGFYGDWNYVPMFDQGFYYDDYSYGSNPTDNFIGASYGNQAYGLGINPYVETEDFSYYMEDRNAVSPNDDGFLDTADTLRLGLMRNAAEVYYQLLDENGEIMADLTGDEDVRKNWYYTSGSYYTNLGTDIPMPHWNASYYAGQDIGLRIYAALSNYGEVTTEPFTEETENYFNEWIIPIYVDVAAPVVEVVSFENGALTLNITDEHYAAYAGAWNGSVVNDEVVLEGEIDGVGIFETERGMTTEVVLEGVSAGNLICVGDYAGNETAYIFDGETLTEGTDSWSHAGVSVPETTFYMYTANLTNRQYWGKFNTTTIENQPSFGVGDSTDTGNNTAACYTGEYVFAADENKNLVRFDADHDNMDTWTNKTTIGAMNVSYGINEMAYDKTTDTLYIVSGLTNIYSVDTETTEVTLACTANYGAAAFDIDENGTCYIVDAFGYFCTLDLATGEETSEIGYFGIVPYGSSGYLMQCGTIANGYFFWEAADASITQYSQIHLLAIKLTTGEYADLGAVWGGLYYLGLFPYIVEIPEPSVDPVDFYENFEGSFDWELIDADGDGNNWAVSYWTQGLYLDGSKAAVSYSWNEVVLTPDNWMISPSFEIGEGEKYLSFFTASANTGAGADIDEHYAVYVLPEGMDIENAIKVYETTMDTAALTEHIVDLSTYAGETVQLVFRHFDCTDEYTLIIDAIGVGDMM